MRERKSDPVPGLAPGWASARRHRPTTGVSGGTSVLARILGTVFPNGCGRRLSVCFLDREVVRCSTFTPGRAL